MRKVFFLGIGISILTVVVLLWSASSFMLDFSLSPTNRGKDLQGSWEYMFQNYPELEAWRDSLVQAGALKDTFIYTPDKARLHGYFVAASQPTSKTAVIVHGYTDNAIRMMMIGYLYT